MAFHDLNDSELLVHLFLSFVFTYCVFVLILLTEHKFDFGFYLYQSKVFIRIADKPILTKRFLYLLLIFLNPNHQLLGSLCLC